MKKQVIFKSPCPHLELQGPSSGEERPPSQPGPRQPAQPPYLQQDPAHIRLSVFSVELTQQQLCREPLGHEVGHPVAIIAIEDPIQEAVVFTSSRGGEGRKRVETRGMKVMGKKGRNRGGTKGRKGFRYSSRPHMVTIISL